MSRLRIWIGVRSGVRLRCRDGRLLLVRGELIGCFGRSEFLVLLNRLRLRRSLVRIDTLRSIDSLYGLDALKRIDRFSSVFLGVRDGRLRYRLGAPWRLCHRSVGVVNSLIDFLCLVARGIVHFTGGRIGKRSWQCVRFRNGRCELTDAEEFVEEGEIADVNRIRAQLLTSQHRG